MLDWVGNDQPMKMRETSRDINKKLCVNNAFIVFRGEFLERRQDK